MKALLVSFLALHAIVGLSYANPDQIEIPDFKYDNKSEKVIYQGHIAAPDTMVGLFFKGFNWLLNNYDEGIDMLKEQDQKTGLLSGTAYCDVQFTDPETGAQHKPEKIHYDFLVVCEDSTYYYQFTNIRLEKDGYFGIEKWIEANKTMYDSRSRSYLVQVDAHMQEMIGLLRGEMTALPEPEDDNWEEAELEQIESAGESGSEE